jgi:hypothetical protein
MGKARRLSTAFSNRRRSSAIPYQPKDRERRQSSSTPAITSRWPNRVGVTRSYALLLFRRGEGSLRCSFPYDRGDGSFQAKTSLLATSTQPSMKALYISTAVSSAIRSLRSPCSGAPARSNRVRPSTILNVSGTVARDRDQHLLRIFPKREVELAVLGRFSDGNPVRCARGGCCWRLSGTVACLGVF